MDPGSNDGGRGGGEPALACDLLGIPASLAVHVVSERPQRHHRTVRRVARRGPRTTTDRGVQSDLQRQPADRGTCDLPAGPPGRSKGPVPRPREGRCTAQPESRRRELLTDAAARPQLDPRRKLGHRMTPAHSPKDLPDLRSSTGSLRLSGTFFSGLLGLFREHQKLLQGFETVS